jgi:DNA-binding NtrC family response regulator
MGLVLVVAAEGVLGAGIARAIRGAGHRAMAAASLPDAGGAARDHSVDAVVIDEEIAPCSADAMLAALGPQRPAVAVLLSQWSTIASFRRSARAGFNLHVVKPCEAEPIASAIALMLSLRDEGRLAANAFDVIRFGCVFPGVRQLVTA